SPTPSRTVPRAPSARLFHSMAEHRKIPDSNHRGTPATRPCHRDYSLTLIVNIQLILTRHYRAVAAGKQKARLSGGPSVILNLPDRMEVQAATTWAQSRTAV